MKVGSTEVRREEVGRCAWPAAIRHIMLRVLPRPMSSANRPPRKSGGSSSVLYPPTLFV
jgi:hypothetical protein